MRCILAEQVVVEVVVEVLVDMTRKRMLFENQ